MQRKHYTEEEKNAVISQYPYDNAVMESFFGTLKKEELYRIRYRSERQMKECIASYIKFYNEERLQVFGGGHGTRTRR